MIRQNVIESAYDSFFMHGLMLSYREVCVDEL